MIHGLEIHVVEINHSIRKGHVLQLRRPTTTECVLEVRLEPTIEETTDHNIQGQDMMTMEDRQELPMILINQLNHLLVCKEVIHLNRQEGHLHPVDKQRPLGFQARQDPIQLRCVVLEVLQDNSR